MLCDFVCLFERVNYLGKKKKNFFFQNYFTSLALDRNLSLFQSSAPSHLHGLEWCSEFADSEEAEPRAELCFLAFIRAGYCTLCPYLLTHLVC